MERGYAIAFAQGHVVLLRHGEVAVGEAIARFGWAIRASSTRK